MNTEKIAERLMLATSRLIGTIYKNSLQVEIFIDADNNVTSRFEKEYKQGRRAVGQAINNIIKEVGPANFKQKPDVTVDARAGRLQVVAFVPFAVEPTADEREIIGDIVRKHVDTIGGAY
jgi:hypothetical protein